MRTEIRSRAPERQHDDWVVALAPANERARRYLQVGATFVFAFAAPAPPSSTGSIHADFVEKRRDPNWGFEPLRWNWGRPG